MQSNDTTPRFRNLSINGMPPITSTSFSFNDNESALTDRTENGCFMCRQANVYLNPIGMQRERQVARHHPPPLSRAKIEELSQKKKLTKREARLLLQCYFPEIKNVKYFQLHKYHSCCYDPKHMNLCKNHITALQHERADDGHHVLHKHRDEDHFKEYERDGGYQNRVSFVRIKIEPTKGIPTRFLGPTALPESLADMLIKQVNRYENIKKPTTFTAETQSTPSMYSRRRLDPPSEDPISTVSEYLGTIGSDDDEELTSDDDDDDDDEFSENTTRHPNTAVSNIYGYNGKIRDHSRNRHDSKLRTISEKTTTTKTISSINGDLTVEDVEELEPLFVRDGQSSQNVQSSQGIQSQHSKKKKRRRRTRKPAHSKPKLNHWEELALKQAKQESCGCRHHVGRVETDQSVDDGRRRKDHSHKDLKGKSKTVPHEQATTATTTTTPPPEKPKVQKKKKDIREKTELALAYDPTAVDYDVIQEILYFRTASGRLVKPEISNSFAYNDALRARGLKVKKTVAHIKEDVATSTSPKTPTPPREVKSTPKRYFLSVANSPIVFQHSDSLSSNKTLFNNESTILRYGLLSLEEIPETPIMRTGIIQGNKENQNNESVKVEEHKSPIPLQVPIRLPEPEPVPQPEIEEIEEADDVDDDDDDDDANEVREDFIPPKYLPQNSNASASPTPRLPMRMQKSTKPTFKNHRPTPNFERESSLIAKRRWYDQALGDQNLLTVHDGQFGLIAGTSAQEYQVEAQAQAQVSDNDYTENEEVPINRGTCTIS